MTQRPGGEFLVALALLAAALAADLFWFRPRLDEFKEASLRRARAEESLWSARSGRIRARELLGYLSGEAGTVDSTLSRSRIADPLEYLETRREEAGLRRLDVRLERRDRKDGVLATSYVMQVSGSFDQHRRFLRTLETGRPLVTIESLDLTKPALDPGVSAKIRLSVLTLEPGGAS
jgi:hypothetical protein